MSGAPGIACRLIDDAAGLRPRRKMFGPAAVTRAIKTGA
jgi:hypothetical protein